MDTILVEIQIQKIIGSIIVVLFNFMQALRLSALIS